MMVNVLLTGAGFSRNWGGWLATDVFEYLISCEDLSENIRGKLWRDWRDGKDFEYTLSGLENNNNDGGRSDFDSLSTTIYGMFNLMNGAFQGSVNNMRGRHEDKLRGFIDKFDEIYTLNVDSLFELLAQEMYGTASFSEVWRSPGTRLRNKDDKGNPALLWKAPRSVIDTDTSIPAGTRPYYKLHGSANWTEEAGGKPLMVLGSKKDTKIRSVNILNRYVDTFSKSISDRPANLVVVGYSFRDEHVNKIISDSISKGALRLFLWDPMGLDAIYPKKNATRSELIPGAEVAIRGVSRRNLLETLNYDSVEYSKIYDFLKV